MSGELRVSFGGDSRPGRKAINQDAFCACLPESRSDRLRKGAVAVVCDGVSSSKDSHIASQTVVTSFARDYMDSPPNWSVNTSIGRILKGLNSWLYQQNPSLRQRQDSLMTTVTAAVIKSRTLHVFHVGDSRLYLLRKGVLERLTRDHVRVERGREYLARALGGDLDLKIDYVQQTLQPGDTLLLTTDGVHGSLSDAEMRNRMLDGDAELESVAQLLVDTALNSGSDDNLSALIARVDELPEETIDEAFARLTERPIPPVMQVGNSIDGYSVLDVIFSGTRSHMYLVRDEQDRRYVLKAPSSNFAEDLTYLDGFTREEWVGQKLRHPNVMRVEPTPPDRRFFYYVGEYIEGRNLREWMQDHPKPTIDQVRRMAKQMIAGLRAFHRADMVHQDIKPENIMIDGAGQIRILDFGTVLVRGADEIASPLDKSVPQGTVNYTAPEYLRGQTGNATSDLFSLAVVLYEMLTGELPYPESNHKQLSLKHWSDIVCTPVSVYRPDIPNWVEAALEKALQPNPRNRYSTLSEFEHDLSVPNRDLAHARESVPLAKRHPLKFWKYLALLLFVVNVVQWIIYSIRT